MQSTLENTGSALLISAATTFAGFGILILAAIPIIQQFGIINASMIMYSFLSAVIILPIPLFIWAKHRAAKGRFKM